MSSKKRTSLDALFAESSAAESIPATVARPPEEAEARVQPSFTPGAQDAGASPAVPSTPLIRRSSLYLSEPVYQQLRRLAFEESVKIHSLYIEGIDRVFKDRGLPSISELQARGRGGG